MIANRLANHVRLCGRNLRSDRVVCCASCPFEDDLTYYFPDLAKLFARKRASLRAKGKAVKHKEIEALACRDD
jgi:hypothetical protein